MEIDRYPCRIRSCWSIGNSSDATMDQCGYFVHSGHPNRFPLRFCRQHCAYALSIQRNLSRPGIQSNEKAKQTPKDANISSKAASASAARVLVPRSKERQAFIAKVLPKTPLQQPAPPRVLEQNKREWGLTSEIPDSKRGRF